MGFSENGIAPEDIRQQLEKIISSGDIKNSHAIARFLQFVIEEKLSGRTDEIKEYTIGVKALGRPANFNPQLDAIVRIHAGRLRKILHEYYRSKGIHDPVIIEIPKGTYVPVFTTRSSYSEKNSEQTTTAIDAPFITVNGHHDTAPSQKPIIAVIPFYNLSGSQEMIHFVDGVGEQLCMDLARFQHISVISYHSTWKYAEDIKDFRELNNLTGAQYVLTGSVRFINDLVRLNVQLSSTVNGIIIWTQTFLRRLTINNTYDVQDAIVEQILAAIADDNGIISNIKAIQASPIIRTKNQSVYEAINLYFIYQKTYDADKCQKAMDALINAAQLEPNNALVLAMLSKLYLDVYAISGTAPAELLDKGAQLAKKAVTLDGNCQHAYQALAWSYLLMGKKDDCLKSIEQCVTLNPKAATITGNMGFGLICLGDYVHGFDLLLRAMYLNPRLPWCSKLGFALYYYQQGKFTDSFIWINKINMPDVPLISLVKIAAQGKLGYDNPELKMLYENLKMGSHINGHIPEIIGQLILDTKMKKQIIDGLRCAGVPVKV